ncbi:TetR/AcrR family transcriptional regulator C-terminal domain-containing protein [Streptomyces sp. NPDC052042]|uniref:TetR/AcrR family transcriptional regulator C-terminal domain-containing protein n=1 Tax=Streptomyces sp. NPDC052042 TaxID=3365683 RepID=UPI0037CCDD1E
MAVYAGQGDARRSMSLLWRAERPEQPRRTPGPGPRPGLSVDAIVTAAIAVADEEGMAALSMRAVGERLGRTAMALYTYVPGKGELLDLMYDAVHAELSGEYGEFEGYGEHGTRGACGTHRACGARGGSGESGRHERCGAAHGERSDAGDWRAGLTAWARDMLEFHLRHPWVLQISQARPVLGPHEYAALDTLVRLLNGTGLEAGPVRRLVGTLTHFVRGCAGTVAEARQAAAVTGESDEEWWFTRSTLLSEVAPDFADRYPSLSAMERDSAPQPPPAVDEDEDTRRGEGKEGGNEGDEEAMPFLEREARKTFALGLGVLLDGIEAAIRRTDAPRDRAG